MSLQSSIYDENPPESGQGASIAGDASVSALLGPQDPGYQPSLTDELEGLDRASSASVFAEPFKTPSIADWNDTNADFKLLRPPVLQEAKKFESFLIFDLRHSESSVAGSPTQLPLDDSYLTKIFDTNISNIYVTTTKVCDLRVLMIGYKASEQYLLVKLDSQVHCLSIKQTSSTETVSEQLTKLSTTVTGYAFGGPTGIVQIRQRNSFKEKESWYLLHNEKHIEVTDVRRLPSLSLVEIKRNLPVEWRIYHRYALFCDKRYLVVCRSVDTLVDIKQKFLQRYETVEGTQGISPEVVWLTQHKKLISDASLKQIFTTIGTPTYGLPQLNSLSQHMPMLHVSSGGEGNAICIDDVFVHFQPPNAVSLEIIFKPHTDLDEGVSTLVVVSPQVSLSGLREELSKVVRREPNSLGITVGGTKLMASRKTNLSQMLTTPGCKITVYPKTKVSLSVEVVESPSQGNDKRTFTISAFSHDVTKVIKSELRALTKSPEYTMDLYFEGRLLVEESTLNENRIRDKDCLEAQVFPNRVKLSVRMPNRKWYELLIDDCSEVTVGQLKDFYNRLDGEENIHTCEQVAIVNGRVVSDTEALGDVMDGWRPLPKVVIVRVENRCFTAATAYKGVFIVCRSTQSTWFQQFKLVQIDNDEEFPGPDVCEKDGRVSAMLQKRRQHPQPPGRVSGIRMAPCHQSLLDESPARDVHPLVPSGWSSPVLTRYGSADASPRRPRNLSHSSSLPNVSARRETPIRLSASSAVRLFEDSSDLDSLDGVQSSTALATGVSELPPEEREEEQRVGMDAEARFEREEDNSTFRSRYPSGASEPNGTVSKIASLPVKERRQSYPPTPMDSQMCSAPVSETIIAQRRDSDITFGKNEAERVTLVRERFQLNPDETLSSSLSLVSQARGAPDLVRKISQMPCSIQRIPSPLSGEGQLTLYKDQQRQMMVLPDPAYKYIPEHVIREIACHLGANGMMTIRALGVSEPEIEDANYRYPKNLQEKYLLCLRAWCKKEGSNANKQTLKETLKKSRRADLCILIDELDPDAKTEEA
ncbi:uncharacterized protein [Littorina saxatilis]|uniref:Uncharacterized protein n=1 Tax=Littorina saxatilis TaxID=31220 RepID=A0AAN9AT18_9CAEN